MLNKDIDECQTENEQLETKMKQSEEAYENLIKVIAEKDRLIDDLMGENASLKIQMEQLLINTQKHSQREALNQRQE